MFKAMSKGGCGGILCLLLVLSASCGGGGNDAGGVANDAPENANEIAEAWSKAADEVNAAWDEWRAESLKADKLPKEEKGVRQIELSKQMHERWMAVLGKLPPLEIRSLSADRVEVATVGRISRLNGNLLEIPVTLSAKEAIQDMLELRLHGADGSVVSQAKPISGRSLEVGEKQVVTISVKWDRGDTTKRAIAYGTIRILDSDAAPAGNFPVGNTR